MTKKLESRIKDALENVEPWRRIPTSVNGVFLVKTPSKGDNGNIMIEINPVDEIGNPIKRRGIFLKQKSELEKFLDVMEDKSLPQVLETLETMSSLGGAEKVGSVKI